LTDEQVEKLRPNTYKKDIKLAYAYRKQIMKQCHNSKSIHKYLQYEVITYMLDTLLRGDKMSMASSLEMRAPLLMTELVEFLQTVPENQLVDRKKPFMHDSKILL
jgi:asparagine synthase (glutamine-hydrolysing)